MFWGIVGICIASFFTASIAAIMGEQASIINEEPEIGGQVIGVIKGTMERHLVLQKGGIPEGIFVTFFNHYDLSNLNHSNL